MANYNDVAFNATKVNALLKDNIYAAGTKYYYETSEGIKTFDTELEAMTYLLNNVDLSVNYKFVPVFYNRTEDGAEKRYSDFVMVMARKTIAVNNNILNYLIASKEASGNVATDVEENANLSSINKDLTAVKGLGLPLLVSVEKTDDDGTTYDIQDNFIYNEYTNDGNSITCNVLFAKLQELTDLVVNNEKINMTLIDITGLPLKATIDGSIEINDALDIYREFVGGTILTMEELEPEEEIPDEPTEPEEMQNDSAYI